MRPFARRRIVGLVGLGVVVAAVLVGVIAPRVWACFSCSESGDCGVCTLRCYALGCKGGKILGAGFNPVDKSFKFSEAAITAKPAEWNSTRQKWEVTTTWGPSEKLGVTDTEPLVVCFDRAGSKDNEYHPIDKSQADHAVKLWTVGGITQWIKGLNGITFTVGSLTATDAAGIKLFTQYSSDGNLVAYDKGPDHFTQDFDNDNRPTLITQVRNESGVDKVVKKTYFHYTSGTMVRKRITVEEYNSDGSKRFQTTIYGYYPSGANLGRIQFIVEAEGVKQYLAADSGNNWLHGINPNAPGDGCDLDNTVTVGDDALKTYASEVFDAYWNWGDTGCSAFNVGKLHQVTEHGGGCCGGGAGQYTFDYYQKPTGDGAGQYPSNPTNDQKRNLWQYCRRITAPSGLQTVEFYNQFDQLIFKVDQKMSSGTVTGCWITHQIYYTADDGACKDGKVKERRHPSACKIYWDTEGKVTVQNGWVTDITPVNTGTDGLVQAYDYGDPSGELACEMVKPGAAGTPCYLRKYTYTSTTYNDATVYRVATETVYPTPWNGTGNEPTDAQITTHAYTYYQVNSVDTHAVKTDTVSYPIVATGHNGAGGTAGTDNTRVVYHYKQDLVYNLYYNDWTKHEDGTYSYTELGTGTWDRGQVTKTVEDVDDTAGLTPPTGFDPPASGHLNLTTTYAYEGEVDTTNHLASTRLKSVTAPDGRKTVYAYLCQKKIVSSKETTTSLVTLVAPHMDTSGHYNYAPIQISVTDLDGHTTISASGDATTGQDGNTAGAGLLNDWVATNEDIYDAFAGTLCACTDSIYDPGTGQLLEVRRYHHLPQATGGGSLGTDYYRTYYRYDATTGWKSREIQVVSGTATSSSVEQVTKYVYDQLGRVTEAHRAVSGTGQDMGSDYSNETSLTFKQTAATFYDEATLGSGTSGVGDGYVTSTLAYYDAANIDTNHAVKTIYHYDYRGRLRGLEPEASPYAVNDVDNLGRVVASALFNSTSNFGGATWPSVLSDVDYAETIETNRRALSTTLYDEKGQVYRTCVYSVNSSGVKSDRIETNNYYDAGGRLVATTSPGQGGTEYFYDGAGRLVESRLVQALESTHYVSGAYQYRDPQPVVAFASLAGGDDQVIQLTHRTYDAAGNVTEQMTLEANHDDATIGMDITNHDDFVQTAVYSWYDEVGRPTATAAYGTCDSAWTYAALTSRPSSAPASSDTVLVTSYAYNTAGRLETVTDPKGIVTKSSYDDLGRTVKVVEDYAESGSPLLRTTLTGYDGLSNVTQLVADINHNDTTLSGGVWTTDADDQVTTYTFYDSSRSPYGAGLVTKIKYPDGDDSDDNVLIEYALDGRPVKRSLQKLSGQNNRTEISFVYDDTFRRLTEQNVTTAGGVDMTVASITTCYDALGRVEYVTSHTDASPDTSTFTDALNQVKYTYNDLGMLDKEYEEHEGAVDTNTTLYVQYNYDSADTTPDDGVFDKALRLVSVRYPNARLVHYTYGAADSLPDSLSRLDAIKDDSGGNPNNTLASYKYNGAARLVLEDQKAAGSTVAELDYYGGSTGTYAGFDRFGRVVDQKWHDNAGTPVVKDRFKYGYDRASNRTWRENNLTHGNQNLPALDEFYTYDNLRRLTNMDRGTLTGGPPYTGISGTPAKEEDYTLDAVGNWSGYVKKTAGSTDLSQTRTHNLVNEITGISGGSWITPAYDARGNMVSGPKPGAETTQLDMTYDAWNRQTKVVDHASSNTIAEYRYDGVTRRITKLLPNGNNWDRTDFYYNKAWQCLEERYGANQAKETLPTSAKIQWLWSVQYIDAPVLRWRDTSNPLDGTLDETLYYCNDANMNVTALINTDGSVAERYVYDPYGKCTIYDDDWSDTVAWANSKQNEILYCGYRFNQETGKYDVRRRPYDFGLGVWPVRDGGYWDLMNLYQYCRSGPTARVDPYGLEIIVPQTSQTTSSPPPVRGASVPDLTTEARPQGIPLDSPSIAQQLREEWSRLGNPSHAKPNVGKGKMSVSGVAVGVLDAIAAEAEKRRGRGPWKDSAQHCWMACYISARYTVSMGSLAAYFESIAELQAPAGDYARDILANHYGAMCPLANIPLFATFPSTMCDCCCQSF